MAVIDPPSSTRIGPPDGPAGRWPASFATFAFMLGLPLALLAAGLTVAIAQAFGAGDSGGRSIAATLAQDIVFVGAAIGLAALVARPTAADFGLVRIPVRRALIWTLGAFLVFYAVSLVYGSLLDAGDEQDTLDTFGAHRATALLVASGVLVIVVAPFAEEIFFRGFVYRAIRNRAGVAGATAIVAFIFGAVHYSGPDTLVVLPVLALLGATFCILYERTGSLYPAIALHVINNAIAFATTADAPGAALVAMSAATISLGLCVTLGLGTGARGQ